MIQNVDIPPSVVVPFFAALIVDIIMEGSLKIIFIVNTLCIFVFILKCKLSFLFLKFEKRSCNKIVNI